MELPNTSSSPRRLPKLTMQQVHDNEQTLKRINRKIDFQKNPRYQNISSLKYADTLKPSTLTLARQNKGAFRCEPSQVIFSNFQKDIIYEFQIVLVNTSKLLRRIKVAPIASEQFVVSQIKYPNQNSGDIASGMRVKIVIRFLPKQIKTYASELVILSEDSVLKVPIYTIRQQPQLEFQSNIDCGSCWTGKKLESIKRIKNIGGDAQFTLSSPNSQTDSNKLISQCFTISPSVFRLKKDEFVDIKIEYTSNNEGTSKMIVNILSQYFQQRKPSFIVKGNSSKANIQLLSINNSQQLSNARTQKLYFQNIVPNQQSTSIISIKNLAHLSLDYFWQVNNDHFTISQNQGSFKPSQKKQFKIMYKSSQYIPEFTKAKIFIGKKGQSKMPQYQIQVTANIEKYQVQLNPQYYEFSEEIVYGTWYEKQTILKNNSPSQIPFNITKTSISSNSQSQILDHGVSVLQPFQQKPLKFRFMIPTFDKKQHSCVYKIDIQNSQTFYFIIKGKCRLPEIIVSQKIDFGLIKTHSQSSSSLQIFNLNQIPLSITINNDFKYYFPEHSYLYDYDEEDYQSIQKRLWISKQQFVLEPKSKIILNCTYSSRSSQSLSETVEIIVEGGINKIIPVVAQVQDAHILLSHSYFNLKQLFVNNIYTLNEFMKKSVKFYLLNLGNIETSFKWENLEQINCRFQFSPSQGVIKPKSKTEISVRIIPLRNSKLSHKTICKTNKQQLILNFQGDIKGLQIKYQLADESLAKKIVIKDSLQLTKTERSEKNPIISLTSSVSRIRQREKIIYPDLTSVDFFNCQINIPKQVDIMLVNNSDLDTEFSVKSIKFAGKIKEESKLQKTSMLKKTMPFSSEMGVAFMAKRELQKSQKQYLKESETGVTIICEPDSGPLKRCSQVKIKITLFNNICGRFIDGLEVQIKNHQTKQFPLNIDIKGTPIGISKNQIGINFNSFFPLYKFGCFPTNSGTIRKQFKVVNKGPRPVELIWNIYSVDKPSTRDPFKFSINAPLLGSSNPISINWQASQPQIQQNSLFSIEPKSKLIQAQQQTSFTISYTTLSQPQVSKSVFIGQPYLVNQTQKTKMQLMPIIPFAQTVKPQLIIDKYRSNLSDDNLIILQKYAGEESGKDLQSVILQNPTDSNLICSFEIDNSQFNIVGTHTNSGSNNLLSKSQNQFTKSLNRSLGGTKSIENCFNIAPSSYVELKLKFGSNIKSNEDWPMINKFRKEGKLVISYSNNDIQEISLLGELYRPVLRLSTNGKQTEDADQIIDFGIVNVKNDKKKTLYLFNTSPVKGKWSLKYVKFPTKRKFQQTLWTKQDHEDSLITDQKQCFNFSVNQGTVQSLTIPIKTMPNTLALPAPDDNYAKTHIPQKIMISFKPKKDILYKSKFKILVQNGQPIQFVLRGMGTYDQQYEK